MDDLHETTKKIEKGILVTVAEKQAADRVIMEHLEELAFLAKTLDIDIQKTFIQKRKT
jgi:GTPase